VSARNGRPHAERVTVYRSARRLMEGFVRVP
jgi:2-methylaconitate cis-trans-isomerase PrpF